MLARIRKSAEEREQGFTLIELLVVMIIIGILAAIAIPVFLSQRAKAQDTAAKNDVSILGKELATYWVDGTAVPYIGISGTNYVLGTSSTVNAAVGRVSTNDTLMDYASTPAASTGLTMTGSSSSAWCVTIKNTSSNNSFKYSAANGLATGSCTAANGS